MKRITLLTISLLYSLFAFSQDYVITQEVQFISIPGGTYIMGCTGQCGGQGTKAEIPRHEVVVDSFELASTEVTNSQYCKFLNDSEKGEDIPVYDDNGWNRKYFGFDAEIEYKDSKWQPKEGRDNYPMICVSWFGAKAFCDYYGWRLPFEAEWEYAARGNQPYVYSGSMNIAEVGWSRENSGEKLHPVAQLKANDFGLYDMSGNVWEWCYDWFDEEYYDLMVKDNPKGPEKGDGKVNRGGSYDYPELSSRVSQRNYDMAKTTDYRLGFRPAR